MATTNAPETTKTSKHRLRRFGAAILVVLACVSMVGGVVGTWARRNFLDTDRFTARMAPLADEPAVQEALTVRITAELMDLIDPAQLFEEVLPGRGRLLAIPLTAAVRDFVNDRVQGFVSSERFAQLWEIAVRNAHETSVRVLRGKSQVVHAVGGEVTIDLIPIIDAVLAGVASASPEILGRQVDIPEITFDDIPSVAIRRLGAALGVDLDESFGQFTVYDDGKLSGAQDGLRIVDRLARALLPVGIVLAGLALIVSPRRRRTLLQLCVGLALGMILVRRIIFTVDDDIIALPPTELGQNAVAVVANTFLNPLTTFAGWFGAALLAVAAIAVATSRYPWVVRTRRRIASAAGAVVTSSSDRLSDERTVAFVHDHRDALLAGGAGVGLVVLWWTSLPWIGTFVVLGLVGVFELVVLRLAASGEVGAGLDPGGAELVDEAPRPGKVA